MINLKPLLPEIFLTLTIISYFVYGFYARSRCSLSLFVFVGGLVTLLLIPLSQGIAFKGFFVADLLSQALKFVFLITLLYVVAFSYSYDQIKDKVYYEYMILLMLSTLGMMLVVSSREFISLFLSIEFMSLSLYLLAGIVLFDFKSNEASLKYFLLGSLASAFLLFGIAIIYGLTKSSYFPDIQGVLQMLSSNEYYLICGILALTLGLAFKAGLAPFHQWSPDVYVGAPTPVTAFFSVAPKGAALGAFMRVFSEAFVVVKDLWTPILVMIALLTLFVANILALRQINLKRLIAYSSIAHAGYVLLAIIAASERGIFALVFYFLVYVFMNLGAFAVILSHSEGENLESYSGLYRANGFLALAMLGFLFSLTGIPPFGGFVAKFLVFQSLVEIGLVWVAVLAIMLSVPSIYYYLRIGVRMFFMDRTKVELIVPSTEVKLITAISLAGVFITGLFPSIFYFIFQ